MKIPGSGPAHLHVLLLITNHNDIYTLLTSLLKKNRMGRGQTDTHTHTYTQRTSRLLERIGPVGRFVEKQIFRLHLGLTDLTIQ